MSVLLGTTELKNCRPIEETSEVDVIYETLPSGTVTILSGSTILKSFQLEFSADTRAEITEVYDITTSQTLTIGTSTYATCLIVKRDPIQWTPDGTPQYIGNVTIAQITHTYPTCTFGSVAIPKPTIDYGFTQDVEEYLVGGGARQIREAAIQLYEFKISMLSMSIADITAIYAKSGKKTLVLSGTSYTNCVITSKSPISYQKAGYYKGEVTIKQAAGSDNVVTFGGSTIPGAQVEYIYDSAVADVILSDGTRAISASTAVNPSWKVKMATTIPGEITTIYTKSGKQTLILDGATTSNCVIMSRDPITVSGIGWYVGGITIMAHTAP
jgi:hypothetical protein